jgi:hypothetical protein
MSPAQQRKALARIALLRRWHETRGDLTASKAADLAEVGTKRFYEMASAWKANERLVDTEAQPETANSLAVLGAFASPGRSTRKRRLDPRAVNALQAVVAKVVADRSGASIEMLRARLVEAARRWLADHDAAGSDAVSMPSKMIVRAMIEREIDRVGESQAIGHAVRLDHAAISLVDGEGRLHVAYMILERAVGMVLGFSLGSPGGVTAGYAAAAADAVARMGAAAPLPWAHSTSNLDMVRGGDEGALDRLVADLVGEKGLPAVTVTRQGEYGRYIRQILGERIGRIYFRGSRTITREAGTDVASGAYGADEARLRLNVEVEAHNRAVTDGLCGKRPPPRNLIAALSRIASAS